MAQPLPVPPWLSPEDYLAAELTADVRHEYVGGQVYALAGASDVHNRLVINLTSALDAHLGAGPCQVYATDLKLRTQRQVYYYPDVMVCCDPTDNARYWRERPRYVFEVTSPQTRHTDAREKALEYFRLPSLEAYVLVAQDAVAVAVHRRAGGDYWAVEWLRAADDVLVLPGIEFALPLARLYRQTGLV
jgi:Uma2 family endonuclease